MNLKKLSREKLQKLDDIEIIKSICTDPDTIYNDGHMWIALNELNLSTSKIYSCMKTFKQNDYLIRTDDMGELERKINKEKLSELELLKLKLQNKFDITIDYIKNSTTKIKDKTGEYIKDNKQKFDTVVCSALIIATVAGTASAFSYIHEVEEAFDNSMVIYEDENYNIHDVFIVYNAEQSWLCTRKLSKVTPNVAVSGNVDTAGRVVNGDVDEYYYRDEIYDYYDIKTGEKICEDYEEYFYIEKLSDFIDKDIAMENDSKFYLENLENALNVDYLLSREPQAVRKGR